MIAYKLILNPLVTISKIDFRDAAEHVIKVQTRWRQYMAKKRVRLLRSSSELK